MNTTTFPAKQRGSADFGWLKANYSFSFARYYNPENTHFGKLRVLNDDVIQGGAGFATHPHANMEIITIPLKGALAHEDSTGASGTIRPNEVQIMSAGTGIEHSEKNALVNAETNLLQIWIIPNEANVEPRYNQQYFDESQRVNQWQIVVSNIHPGAMRIHQDAVLSRLILEEGRTISYKMHFKENGIFLFVISGELSINQLLLQQRDAVGIQDVEEFNLKANKKSELIAIEVPMK